MNGLLLFAIVFFPMLAALAVFFIGEERERALTLSTVGFAAAELALAVCLIFSDGALDAQNVFSLGLHLTCGSFQTMMCALAAFSWLVASVMCVEYMEHYAHKRRFFAFWLLTEGAVMGVFLAADLMTAFIFLEIMSFTSWVLVIHTEKPDAIRAGETYIAVAVICGMVSLLGLVLLYREAGTLTISELSGTALTPGVLTAGILTAVGFAAKAGLFPMHIWLPTAHPAAPAPASAVLSGIITKTGVFGVLTLTARLFIGVAEWGVLLLALGCVTMVLGAGMALFSTDLKHAFACSSVSQIGFVAVGLSMLCLLGAEHNALAAAGTVLHILNHSLIKLVLFPASGIIYLTTHTFELDRLRGFGRGKPLLALIMGVPMLSLAGMPGLSGYVSKTLLHESILELYGELSAHASALAPWVKASEYLFLFAGGLTLAYMLKLFTAVFLDKPDAEPSPGARYMRPVSWIPLLLCSLAIPVLGLFPNSVMDSVAAFASPFLTSAAHHGAINYFSMANLSGGFVSLAIGLAVYFLFVRTVLIRDVHYVNLIPGWLSLENSVYRPLLRLLTSAGALLASAADAGIALLISLLSDAGAAVARGLDTAVNLCQSLMSRFLLHRQSRNYEWRTDDFFAKYGSAPVRSGAFLRTLAYGLAVTSVGALLFITYLIVAM